MLGRYATKCGSVILRHFDRLLVYLLLPSEFPSLQWRRNGHDGVTSHQSHDCLLKRRWKKTAKYCVTGLCAGNSSVTGEFPTQMVSYAENVFIWWRHHVRGMPYREQWEIQISHVIWINPHGIFLRRVHHMPKPKKILVKLIWMYFLIIISAYAPEP